MAMSQKDLFNLIDSVINEDAASTLKYVISDDDVINVFPKLRINEVWEPTDRAGFRIIEVLWYNAEGKWSWVLRALKCDGSYIVPLGPTD